MKDLGSQKEVCSSWNGDRWLGWDRPGDEQQGSWKWVFPPDSRLQLEGPGASSAVMESRGIMTFAN